MERREEVFMAPRKPPGMSFESFTEKQIEAARKEGLFDDLPGKGKPLAPTRARSDRLWWTKKLMQREGISILPPALEIRKTVEQEMTRIMTLRSEQKVRESVAALNEKILYVNRNNVSGPPTTQAALDAETVVEKWRAARSPEGEGSAG